VDFAVAAPLAGAFSGTGESAMDHAEILLYLLADLVVIILAARCFGALARRLNQPAVIGEVLAGIVLGPTVLGRIIPSAPAWLFPPDVPLKPIADLGLVFFMFLVGLELDTDLMRKEGRRAVQISLSGVIAPFLLGALLALVLAPVNEAGVFADGTHHPPSRLAFALFLGAAMCITAFPILARIMVETGLYRTPVGMAALCAAAVDDAIAWILLAAVIGIAKNGSPAQALPALLLTIVFVAFMFTVGRALLGRLARRYEAKGALSIDMVAVIVASVLASAFATEKIGIHAIFGAFVLGAVMPRNSGMVRDLTEKIEDFTVIILLPVFFAVTGLRTDLFTLNSPALLGWLVLIVLVATLGKFLGTGLAARLTGSSARDSIVIGALMNTRGLTELVILSIGLSLGVLSDRVFAMMVIMALVTTVMGAPIVTRLVSRDELMGALVGPAAGPARPASRILVALGNPLNAPALVAAGIALTGLRRPAELLLVRLIPTPRAPEFSTGLRDVELQVAAAVESMKPLVEQAAAAGVIARPIAFLTDAVGPDLARIAVDQECELVLLGWHRASLAQHVIEALVREVFTRAPCDAAVFVDRDGLGMPADPGEKPVVMTLAGGAQDDASERLAERLTRSLLVGVRVFGYVGPRTAAPATDESRAISARADAMRQSTGLWAVPAPLDAAQPVVAAFVAETAVASLVVVPCGDDWVSAGRFGNPANELAAAAECPALVVRAAEAPGAPRPAPGGQGHRSSTHSGVNPAAASDGHHR
jgi:Kef-type K+ transport system membrane component KefB